MWWCSRAVSSCWFSLPAIGIWQIYSVLAHCNSTYECDGVVELQVPVGSDADADGSPNQWLGKDLGSDMNTVFYLWMLWCRDWAKLRKSDMNTVYSISVLYFYLWMWWCSRAVSSCWLSLSAIRIRQIYSVLAHCNSTNECDGVVELQVPVGSSDSAISILQICSVLAHCNSTYECDCVV
jgi:hypothetical protein